MADNIQLQRVLTAQPLHRIRWFASLLGWQGLQLEYVNFPPQDAARYGLTNTGGIAVHYITPDEKFNLQINTYPHGQTCEHSATVKADRYRIVYVGWHPFTLFDDEQRLAAEAARLKPFLFRANFKDRSWRKEFLRKYPQP